MDIKAIEMVTNYIMEYLDKSDKGMIPDLDFTVYAVWKYLISSTFENKAITC